MRLIDADKLFDEIGRNDLEFMHQLDLMACIKDIIDKQPTAYDVDNIEADKAIKMGE